MAKIKITDLPKDTQISREEMKKVFGGITAQVQVQGRTPTLINRHVNRGDLVSDFCDGGCTCNCACDCEYCRPTDAIRTR